MSQVEFESLLARYAEGNLTKEEQRSLEKLVATNPQWQAEMDVVNRMQQLANQWRDEKVPHWHRQPYQLPPSSRWMSWFRWTPLALGCGLMLAVLFQVRVVKSENGFDLMFGHNQLTDSQLKQVEQGIQDVLDQRDQEFSQHLTKALTDMSEQQEDRMQALLAEYDQQSQSLRNKEFDTLLANWRKQRDLDLHVISSRYQDLYDASLANRNGLISLAQYVKK
ncbi:MAG: hypothetical protein KDC35_21105 [Acidobacteria bacterium]|nr:hypothetical protein [Acidobacteriota bacterium]